MAYRLIYVKNGVTKQTSDCRFSDVDNWVIKYLNKDKKNIVHDIAVSNGVTSLQFFNTIKQNSYNTEFYISDKFSKLYISGSSIMKVYDRDNELLFGYIFCFVATDNIKMFILSKILFSLLKKSRVNRNLNEILLYDNTVKKAINNSQIIDIDYDVFNDKTYIDTFTFVRCMNLLNYNYFDTDTIKSGILNIKQSLKENGHLLVGRTNQNGINQASLFIKQNNSFILVENYNEGSEIQKIIES
jgi:hypothetical protein